MIKKITSILILISLLVLFPTFVLAQDNNQNKKEQKIITLPAGQVVNGDYFAAGDMVEVFGTVNGDVYVVGGQVTINGTVNGDVLAAGGTIDIGGKVTQDVRIVGGQINLMGEIGRNITVGGGNITIGNNAKINGGAVIGGGNVTIAGPIGKELMIGAGNVTISSDIRGNVEAGVGNLRLTSKAHVFGDLNYWSNQEASVDEMAKVDGQSKQNFVEKQTVPKAEIAGALAGAYLWLKLISFLSALFIGFLIWQFFPKFTTSATEVMKNRTWAVLGIGFLALILIPILIIVLLITIIGIIPAIFLTMWYIVALYLAKIWTAFYIGSLIMRSDKEIPFLGFLLGLIIYYVITFIPLIGGIVSFLAVIGGLGVLIITKRDAYLTLRKNKAI